MCVRLSLSLYLRVFLSLFLSPFLSLSPSLSFFARFSPISLPISLYLSVFLCASLSFSLSLLSCRARANGLDGCGCVRVCVTVSALRLHFGRVSPIVNTLLLLTLSPPVWIRLMVCKST